MAAHKKIDRICCAVLILSLIVTILFMNGEALGLQASAAALGYETRLFDTTRVHTIDIVMDDWDTFIEGCEDEEYEPCAVVIDGESYKNVAIRAKGNTSLSSVRQLGSQRYSFKIEFDHYDSGKTYHGLDKLCLNNLIQDNTMMKDYLVYRLMGAFGVASPLCSYVYITVNGEDWGLYLAVEGAEDAFLERNYGKEAGELYKPDSMSFDADGFEPPEQGDFTPGDFPGSPPGDFQMPDNADGTPPEMPDAAADEEASAAADETGTDAEASAQTGENRSRPEMPGGGFGGGSGSDDVKLQYIDDDANSYPNIFDNAKTDVSGKDEKRLIASLRKLSSYEDLEDVLDMDAVLRYFVVHNFVVNGDSYTGSMIHNYYLYEQDGKLSMLPWDYNLAFGGFQGSDAESAVNDPIDDVLSDRPMQAWMFSSEEYTALYHEYYEEFLQSADIDGLIDEAYSLIAPYVEKDPTKFCTYDEFETGVQTLKNFCYLRVQSVTGQLDGSIPSTSEAQKESSESLVDASAITISDMGSMGNTMGGKGGFGGRQNDDADKSDAADTEGFTPPQRPDSSADAGTDFEADTQGGPPQSPPDSQNGTSPGQTDGQGSSRTSGTQTVLLAACALVLALGLGFEVFYKRR
ncbi:hypothetical protein [Oscillospiraceae bacterium]|nr:hypothetical protein [Oscillospiraceae bacterium]